MKKVISMVSILSLLSLQSCRGGNEGDDLPGSEYPREAFGQYHHRDSSGASYSVEDKDKEPPRKDLLQWKVKPGKNASDDTGTKP